MKKESNNLPTIKNSTAEFLIFSKQSGGDNIEVRVQDGTVWLTQKLIGKLFDKTPENILTHLKNIFASNELDENSVTKKYLVTATDGKNYNTLHYNLDTIIAVGYRVNSNKATDFRKWATRVLSDFTLHGYVLDKKRMENGTFFDEDYFERLLEEVREIRLSERRFWQKITDIYATAFNYDAGSQTTKDFFAKVQNKVHFAVHHQTASEVIYDRANAGKENMGLTAWDKAPNGKIVKTDVTIAKNYLTKDELDNLAQIVSGYLDIAEQRAKSKIPMDMESWAKHLDIVISASGKDLLENAGKITRELANEKAYGEFEKYRPIQDKTFASDYDKYIEEIVKIDKNKK
ncbi:MAG: virulence RhuM family protein [Clostridiales bacterium]|jgi:hypothetical protein|nr:virulence RhuM family protein [Clostridiales bacterium]